MYSVKKKFQVEYAHRLIHLKEGHKCRNLHGHSGVITVECFSEKLQDNGFVIDFSDFKKVKEYLDDKFDHAVIIDIKDTELQEICSNLGTRHTVIQADSSSSEVLAMLIHGFVNNAYFKMFSKITVTWSETQNNFATYSSEV